MKNIEEQIKQENFEYQKCQLRLRELRKDRKFAIVGTLGSLALIGMNISLTTDVNYALATTGIIVFPSAINYLTHTQTQINDTLTERNLHADNIENYQKHI